jgi:hypothetical protein
MSSLEKVDNSETINRDESDLLWCAGVGFFLIFILSRFMPMDKGHLAGEKYEWMLYLVTGFIYPSHSFLYLSLCWVSSSI